jgi:LPXTG-motif cell wall-anchored protein
MFSLFSIGLMIALGSAFVVVRRKRKSGASAAH